MSQTNTLQKDSASIYDLLSLQNPLFIHQIGEFCASINSSAEKGHQMMPFLLVVRQDFAKN
ncbi:hypothetical protein BCU66_007355 [Vibrio sp. 10N.286.49.B1]|uniref:hypothetical protein n=1 Tax=unclassified Vibrio TaxID=2614977 RepID=UPI000C818D57|nr:MULTISPECIES: hypothetical protein [unclassified Vibrio]PMH48956.1 hypothetical protein BCU66_21090 [Vibrio sp. 10N.286.49.B1]PMH82117.1 hypothetical protein BCU58_19255 [Vibrio sp. 10N.286.48.B7]